MKLCVCMFVCVCVCVCARAVCVYERSHMYMYVSVCVHVCTFINWTVDSDNVWMHELCHHYDLFIEIVFFQLRTCFLESNEYINH